MHEEKGLGQG